MFHWFLFQLKKKKFKQQFVTILLLQMYYFSNFRALCHVICIKYTYFPSSLFLPCLLSNGILSYTPAKLDLDVMYNSTQKMGKHRKWKMFVQEPTRYSQKNWSRLLRIQYSIEFLQILEQCMRCTVHSSLE